MAGRTYSVATQSSSLTIEIGAPPDLQATACSIFRPNEECAQLLRLLAHIIYTLRPLNKNIPD